MSSLLTTDAETLWRHATSASGVNREFAPLMRMTFPRGVDDLLAGWRPGERRFRSWMLLVGVVPVEYDDVVFEEVEPGRRFLERSSMFTQRVWEHERTVEPVAGGARITDRVHYEPRLALTDVVTRPIFVGTFRWRHRNLRRLFGELPAQSSSG